MLVSLFWFLCGSLCAALLLRRAEHRALPVASAGRARSRRAWLDRSSTMGAALPDPRLADWQRDDEPHEDPPHDRLTSRPRPTPVRHLLVEARHAVRPAFGIRMRVRE